MGILTARAESRIRTITVTFFGAVDLTGASRVMVLVSWFTRVATCGQFKVGILASSADSWLIAFTAHRTVGNTQLLFVVVRKILLTDSAFKIGIHVGIYALLALLSVTTETADWAGRYTGASVRI